MRTTPSPIAKHAVDAFWNGLDAARGGDPVVSVYPIAITGIAKIRRWISAGDRKMARMVAREAG
jgi:hypothetical protein